MRVWDVARFLGGSTLVLGQVPGQVPRGAAGVLTAREPGVLTAREPVMFLLQVLSACAPQLTACEPGVLTSSTGTTGPRPKGPHGPPSWSDANRGRSRFSRTPVERTAYAAGSGGGSDRAAGRDATAASDTPMVSDEFAQLP